MPDTNYIYTYRSVRNEEELKSFVHILGVKTLLGLKAPDTLIRRNVQSNPNVFQSIS